MSGDPGEFSRRAALGLAASAPALGLAACVQRGEPGGVTAGEDLAREHGVLRRVLIVYRESADGLRQGRPEVEPGALAEAADLFRRFGEDYHERQLEEAHIFPVIEKAGGEAAALIPILRAQHARGREITAFIRDMTATGRVAPANVEPLARAMVAMARMYEAHTAFEDTVVFPAWRAAMGARAYDEASAEFEAIERKTFKGDGFDWALSQIVQIEQRLQLHDLSLYTAAPVGPPPVGPKRSPATGGERG